MREDHRQSRLTTAHNTIASKHPRREIVLHAVRPILVPVLIGVGLVAVVVFGFRSLGEAVSISPVLLVLASLSVLGVLVGVGLVLTRPRSGIPRSWRKYM